MQSGITISTISSQQPINPQGRFLAGLAGNSIRWQVQTNKGEHMKALTTAVASVVLYVCTLGAVQAADKHLFYIHGCCIKSSSDPKVHERIGNSTA